MRLKFLPVGNKRRLQHGSGQLITLVDDDVHAELAKLGRKLQVFAVKSRGYAALKIKGRMVGLHRWIMNPAKDKVVDHINGNTLDNTRANLRIVTPAENSRNRLPNARTTSNYAGVVRVQQRHGVRYRVRVDFDHKQWHIGNYRTEEEAARAYDAVVQARLGRQQVLNFPASAHEIQTTLTSGFIAPLDISQVIEIDGAVPVVLRFVD